MASALISALKSASVPVVLLATGLGVASVSRPWSDPEAFRAEAARPAPLCPPEMLGFRLPGPDEYPHEYMPWIRSREDFIAYLTRGEDPEVVRRHAEGPEEELIAYLGEVQSRPGWQYPSGPPVPAAPGMALAPPSR